MHSFEANPALKTNTEFKITPVSKALAAELQNEMDQKTKPLGALGKLESLALQIGCIQNSLTPSLEKPTILVFAGDHGITEEGVSPYPSEVTGQMVLNFLAGGAAINVFCRQHGIALKVVNAGVKTVLPEHPDLINFKVAAGTENFKYRAAMTEMEFESAVHRGADLVSVMEAGGTNIIGFGEMGIGNTSSAAAIMACLTSLPFAECVGRGTGLDNAGITHKTRVIEEAVGNCVTLDKTDPRAVLRYFGGLEMAMMAGALLKAAERKLVVMVDGFIASAVALVCLQWYPNCRDYLVFTHLSGERGHQKMLEHIDAQPLVNLGMRLGEGSGVAVVYPIIASAVTFLNEMATFASASVSERSE